MKNEPGFTGIANAAARHEGWLGNCQSGGKLVPAGLTAQRS